MESKLNLTNVRKGKYNPNVCVKNELGCDSVSFTGKKKSADAPKKKSGVIHKALVATTGAFIPGLGQALNGQWGKAAFFLVGAPAITLAALCVSVPLAVAVGTAAEIGMYIDAYRNA